LSELQENWRALQQLARRRNDALAAAYTRHKFYADLHELDVWVAETIKRMGSSELPATSAEAEAMLELHQERKV
jgi:spectrin beta